MLLVKTPPGGISRPWPDAPRRTPAWVLAPMLALILAPAGAACNRGPAPELDELGDPCRSISRSCEDEATLRVCEDQVWTAVSCAERCAAQTPGATPLACADPGEGFLGDECACSPPQGAPCEPGATACEALTLLGCEPTGLWRAYPCDELCAASEPLPLAAEACAVGEDGVATCVCSAEGAPCNDEGALQCADRTTLATCTAAAWTFTRCSCPPPPGGGPPAPGLCLPLPDGGASCTC